MVIYFMDLAIVARFWSFFLHFYLVDLHTCIICVFWLYDLDNLVRILSTPQFKCIIFSNASWCHGLFCCLAFVWICFVCETLRFIFSASPAASDIWCLSQPAINGYMDPSFICFMLFESCFKYRLMFLKQQCLIYSDI